MIIFGTDKGFLASVFFLNFKFVHIINVGHGG